MTQTEFIEKEFQFLQQVKDTDIYKRLIALSKEIDGNQNLAALSKERDAFFLKADQEEDKIKKREYLILFNQKDEELRSSPLMKEYLSLYEALQSIFRELSIQLTKEMKE